MERLASSRIGPGFFLDPTVAEQIAAAGLALDEGRARAGWAGGRAVEVVVGRGTLIRRSSGGAPA